MTPQQQIDNDMKIELTMDNGVILTVKEGSKRVSVPSALVEEP
jgi:hypothetical protein